MSEVKKAFFEMMLYQAILHDEIGQQWVLRAPHLIDEANFTAENIEKLKQSSAYKSVLYYDALKNIH